MKLKNPRFILFCISSVFLLACSQDPKQASVANFETVLRNYYADQPPMCHHKFYEAFPIKVSTLSHSKEDPKRGNPPELLLQLVNAGILTKNEAESKVVNQNLAVYGPGGLVQKTFVFDVTFEGKKWYVPPKLENGKRSDGGLCFGKEKVIKVDQFTEPADFFGMRISKVTYLVQVDEIPDWAKTEAILSVMPQLKPAVESSKLPLKIERTLSLTNTGWAMAK